MRDLSETQVAAAVVAWLRDLDWEVYQEVQVAGGSRADIVAVRGPLVWVVEAKTSMSLTLLEQATYWICRCNYVSVAVPKRNWRIEKNLFVDRYVRDLGIGRFAVTGRPGQSYDPLRASEDVVAKFHRRCDQSNIRKSLHEAQKTSVAGSAGGGYWTPFRQTCANLRDFLEQHPGATMKAAIDGIKHHYATPSSARGSLRKWIEAGKLEGVAMVDGAPRIVGKANPDEYSIARRLW